MTHINTEHIILGISGRAQSGKTTLANHLAEQLTYGGLYDTVNYSVKILSFADYLKNILKDLFLVDDYYLNDDVGKTKHTQYTWLNIKGENYWGDNATEYMTGRELMEHFGAEFRRMNPMAWVNGVISKITNTVERSIFIIPDVRAPNEIGAIIDMGGITIRLDRDPLKRNSVIETALDRDKYNWNNFDLVINNSNMDLETKNKHGLNFFIKEYGAIL